MSRQQPQMTVVVATGNRHKVAEIQAILDGHDGPDGFHGLDPMQVRLVPMTELGLPSPPEDGATFEDNALIKARACAKASGLVAIADDSGLEVDALGGAPGVFSARYAGPGASDADNNERLLAELDGVPVSERTARFVCAAAIAAPDGREVVLRGTMEGRILEAPRGDGGFGYDPLFVADARDDGRTNAELSPAQKDAISHRGAAFRALRPHIGAIAR